jgi:DNA-directed RNA polymerase subunit RPC12/RpoP
MSLKFTEKKMEIKCILCHKEYLVDEERWDDGHIFTCYECNGERFSKVHSNN